MDTLLGGPAAREELRAFCGVERAKGEIEAIEGQIRPSLRICHSEWLAGIRSSIETYEDSEPLPSL